MLLTLHQKGGGGSNDDVNDDGAITWDGLDDRAGVRKEHLMPVLKMVWTGWTGFCLPFHLSEDIQTTRGFCQRLKKNYLFHLSGCSHATPVVYNCTEKPASRRGVWWPSPSGCPGTWISGGSSSFWVFLTNSCYQLHPGGLTSPKKMSSNQPVCNHIKLLQRSFKKCTVYIVHVISGINWVFNCPDLLLLENSKLQTFFGAQSMIGLLRFSRKRKW